MRSVENTYAKLVGSKLKECRDRRGLTQREIGIKLGFSSGCISELERGKTGRMSLYRLSLVCGLLGIHPDSLISEAFEQVFKIPNEASKVIAARNRTIAELNQKIESQQRNIERLAKIATRQDQNFAQKNEEIDLSNINISAESNVISVTIIMFMVFFIFSSAIFLIIKYGAAS